MKANKIFWTALLFLNWAIIIGFWLKNSGTLLNDGLAANLIAFGRLSGLAAAYTILLQFFFMGRMVWLEKAFGLDTLSRIHSRNGKRSFYLILAHPILLVLGYKMTAGVSVWSQFKSFLFEYEHVGLAFFGMILFFVVIATSIYVARTKMRYESWYFVHLFAYLAVFFSFFHQITLGEDLLANNLFYWYWIALYIGVFASHVAFRFIRPAYLYFHHSFEVSRIVRENYNTVSVYIKGKNLKDFDIHAGQFMIHRFLKKGMWWQAHPFSLSMIPNSNEIRITVKELGDFTKTVKDIPIGTKMMIEGPYGAFTDLFGVSNKVLLIAGGIGITPIRSLMEEMLKKGKDVVLLYANRTSEDIVFKKEIEEIAAKYPARVSHVLSHDEKFAGEKGYIDEKKLKRLVPDLSSRDVYLCGPVPMMDALVATFAKLGLEKSKIHFEKFSLA